MPAFGPPSDLRIMENRMDTPVDVCCDDPGFVVDTDMLGMNDEGAANGTCHRRRNR